MSKKTLLVRRFCGTASCAKASTFVFGYPGGAILPAYDAMRIIPSGTFSYGTSRGPAHGRRLARAQRQSRRGDRHFRPGATNMVTGIATAMMDSSPIVCITGQVGSGLIGLMRSRKPISRASPADHEHNFLVTHASDVASAIREAFAMRRAGDRARARDITKDAQLGAAEFVGTRRRPTSKRSHVPAIRWVSIRIALITLLRAVDSRRSRHHPRRCRGSASGICEKTQVPVAMTLLGIGCSRHRTR